MAKKRILVVDNPADRRILRAKAKKVSRFDTYLSRLVDDMWETMRAAPGVGLAAPQVGETIRVLVAEYEENAVTLVNPEIIKRSEEEEVGLEGCLSIPGYVGEDVPRASAITVKARDPHGKEIRVKADGWWARILQHEIDHLDGVLYTDRIPAEQVRRVTEDDTEVDEGGPSSSQERAGQTPRAGDGSQRSAQRSAQTSPQGGSPASVAAGGGE